MSTFPLFDIDTYEIIPTPLTPALDVSLLGIDGVLLHLGGVGHPYVSDNSVS
ncbi:MAG: hypothetical protein O3A33_03180 [Chloroflexi bacterium]|nr:hypothetical protein [Chloroflexota bacterium]